MSSTENDIALDIRNIQKSFYSAGEKTVVVDSFTMQLQSGKFASIIGHSGCGKSTVLNMIGGLEAPEFGSISIEGKQITGAGVDRGMVFQSPNLLPWMTVLENVRLGVDQVLPGESRKQRNEVCSYYLDKVGLGADLRKKPAELSQGMRQRVGIARAFAVRPKVLLLDEPFGTMDSVTRLDLQDVLLSIWESEKTTTVLVTHDVEEALYLSDTIFMMTKGPHATIGEILSVPIPHPRDREALVDNIKYQELTERVLYFLENNNS